MAEKDFRGERFSEVSRREGKINVEILGEKQVIDYKSTNYMNADATIGYAMVKSSNPSMTEEKEDDKILFVSKTPTCTVYTMLADRNDELPFNVEGVRVWGVSGGGLEDYYTQHLRALKDEAPLSDAEWLKDALENAPQTILDLAMKMLGTLLEAMGGPDGIMKAMQDAFTGPDSPLTQMAKGLGDAMKTGLGGGDDKGCDCGQDGEGAHTCESKPDGSEGKPEVDALTEEERCGCTCTDGECKTASKAKKEPKKGAAVKKPEPKKEPKKVIAVKKPEPKKVVAVKKPAPKKAAAAKKHPKKPFSRAVMAVSVKRKAAKKTVSKAVVKGKTGKRGAVKGKVAKSQPGKKGGRKVAAKKSGSWKKGKR